MLRDIVNRELVTVEPDAKVSEVARLMADEDVGAVLCLSNGHPRGIITDRDIVVRCLARNIDVNDCTVENVMSESIETCRETEGIFDCIQKMRDARVRRMPVVNEQGEVIGIISFGDLLAVLSKEFAELTGAATGSDEAKKAA